MKIVLDTNILINGFKDDYSLESKIIQEVIEGRLQAYANKQTLQENKLILNQLIDNDEYKNRLRKLFTCVMWVKNLHEINVVRDPDDNKILESAVQAKADYLITNDNDLLSLEKYEDVKLANPTQFWSSYKDEGLELWESWKKFISKNN